MNTMEKKYQEKYQFLKKLVLKNSTFEIEDQRLHGVDNFGDEYLEINQVAVWFESFGETWSICFQNGDMNGEDRGIGVFCNDGAREGLDDFREILEKIPDFQFLIEDDFLTNFIYDFIRDFRKKHKINNYFEE